jgi:dinuclear metal center YbgI/SA1388 family protein
MILKKLDLRLNEVFHKNLALGWDKVGLQIGNLENDIKRILVTLNIVDRVIDEAISLKSDLIFSHHPLIFDPPDTILSSRTGEKEILKLIENNIAAYSAHTNYDSMSGGLNELLASSIGLVDMEVIEKSEEQPDGAGIGRLGRLKDKKAFKIFSEELKMRLGIEGFTWMVKEEENIKDRNISKVAVICGSAGSLTDALIDSGCDTVIAGELGYHNALKISESGILVISLGHGSSEKMAVGGIYSILEDFFKKQNINIEVLKSTKGLNLWRYDIG